MNILSLSWETGVTFRVGEFDGSRAAVVIQSIDPVKERVKYTIYRDGFDDFVGVGHDVEEFKEELLAWFIADAFRHRMEIDGVLEGSFDLDERKEWVDNVEQAIRGDFRTL